MDALRAAGCHVELSEPECSTDERVSNPVITFARTLEEEIESAGNGSERLFSKILISESVSSCRRSQRCATASMLCSVECRRRLR